ncbi:MAG: CPBP family intramembrane metalloprotease [bacterium]|nr:CPBP family intramembrane metalloprotease [bacterium]
MIETLLHDSIGYPYLRYILNYGIYYPLILTAVLVCLAGVYGRLIALGYDKRLIKKFIGILVISVFPAAVLSARAANMFYHPPNLWSVSFFFQELFSGQFVTFHAGIFLPTIIVLLLIYTMKLKLGDVSDTFFLYLPLGHAIGRVGCLLVGCCWGNELSFFLFGSSCSFDNPTPLYAILLNLGLFFGLRFLYTKIHFSENTAGLKGLVSAFYLILYGNIRLVMEVFRRELVLSGGLTQAQVVAVSFIVGGSCILVWLLVKNLFLERENGAALFEEKKPLLVSLFGFLGMYSVIAGVSYYLLINQIVAWPFFRIETLDDAYHTIFSYAPFAGVAMLSMVWLRVSKIPSGPFFEWKNFSRVFYIGIAASLGYSLYVLVPMKFGLARFEFWPVVLVLSVLNAYSEEIIFRLVFFQILKRLTGHFIAANIFQAILYAVLHYFIGGFWFALPALVYGFILGYIMEENKSILPGIICHFIIDLGAIGGPLLV